jgi:hypothetical protein
MHYVQGWLTIGVHKECRLTEQVGALEPFQVEHGDIWGNLRRAG